MSYSTINRADSVTSDVVRITERTNSGIHSISLSRIAVGFIHSGVKYLYHSDRCFAAEEGDIFILDPGFHYEENIVGDNGRFEQIIFYLTPATLQQVLFGLNINCGLSFSSRHSCHNCLAHNFAIAKSDSPIHNFFIGIDLSLRNSGLLHNDIGQRIKLNELIYLILSGEDNCAKRKLLRLTDTTSGQVVNTIYDNLFNNISVEILAELTNRSLTSFKKEFKRIFNKPPHRWIIEQRLDRAKILLYSTSQTISEIGSECGFTNISHFIKLFKLRYHCTPAIFRRQYSLTNGNELRRAVGE